MLEQSEHIIVIDVKHQSDHSTKKNHLYITAAVESILRHFLFCILNKLLHDHTILIQLEEPVKFVKGRNC